MEFANCRQCRKIFQKTSEAICLRCIQKDDEEYETVRRYVRDNPTSGITEVSEATEVSTKKIMGYIRDGRLLVSSAGINCRRCGISIDSGHLCDVCVGSFSGLADAFASHAAPEQPKPPPVVERKTAKMHIKARVR
jgi:flagellar operon protein (TIGR03826 family)